MKRMTVLVAFAALMLSLVAAFTVPTSAQELTGFDTVAFNNISFSYDPSLGSNVGIQAFAGDDPTLEMPGGAQPPYTEFRVYDAPPGESIYDADLSVRVYSASEMGAYADSLAQFSSLQALLASRADLTAYQTGNTDPLVALPYLPVAPAAQVIRARAEYVDTPIMSGIKYITAYRQDASPFLSNEFSYTFQGITNDGAYYVMALLNFDTPLFPSELDADFNYDEFITTMQEYLDESVATFNAAGAESFTPALSTLDTVINSLTIGGMVIDDGGVAIPVEPTATTVVNTDPTLGGLAGTWTLISYGTVEAPTLAIETTPITVSFSETGVAGNSGCNSFSGNFTYNNGTMLISPLVMTRMACTDEALNAQEAAFITALQGAQVYAISNGVLALTYTTPEGTSGVLTFAAAQ